MFCFACWDVHGSDQSCAEGAEASRAYDAEMDKREHRDSCGWAMYGSPAICTCPPTTCPHCGAPAGPDHHAPTRDHLGTAISECESNRIASDGP